MQYQLVVDDPAHAYIKLTGDSGYTNGTVMRPLTDFAATPWPADLNVEMTKLGLWIAHTPPTPFQVSMLRDSAVRTLAAAKKESEDAARKAKAAPPSAAAKAHQAKVQQMYEAHNG